MSENYDLLRKLKETINAQGIESFHMLEDSVPIEEQMKYFRYFEKLRIENTPFERDEEIDVLFSSDASVERKKQSLSLLATIPDVTAYRSIETYQSSPLEPELRNWASMALISSRIVLSSDLSGQQQIYVSSGLGGLDRKLRFFSLFTTSNREPFTKLQKEIVEREFRFQLEQSDIEIEKIDIHDNYFTILLLLPIDKDVQTNLRDAINESNQYGNFLDKRFLLTNTKILSEKEINSLLEKS